jgi:hypothetical protein
MAPLTPNACEAQFREDIAAQLPTLGDGDGDVVVSAERICSNWRDRAWRTVDLYQYVALELLKKNNVAVIHNRRSSHATKEKEQANVQASFGSYDHRVDNSDRLSSCRTSPIQDKGWNTQLSACTRHWLYRRFS